MVRPEEWPLVRRLFEQALDLDHGEREAWVRLASGDDEALAGDVLDLLSADDREEQGSSVDRRAAAWLAEPDLSGTTLAGYEIEHRIGEGGMGTVYAARQQRPQRTVALKTLGVRSFGERARRRFEDEAEILARLQHPAIAQVIEAGTARIGETDVPWFVMELVEAPSTIDRFVREASLDPHAIAALFAIVCQAVQYAHERGVIHRDLKPANVLVDRHGRPKVIDFGIARLLGDEQRPGATRTGEVLGTLAYMCPERLEGTSDGADTAADVYALGVMLYELLGGRAPFEVEGQSPARVIDALRTHDPPPPSRLAPGVPPELDWIALKAMARERARRYGSAGEMARDLGRALRHEPVEAGPPSATYRLRKLAWRHRLLLAAAASVFVAVSIGFAVAAVGWRRVAESELLARRRADTLQEVNRFQERILRAGYGTAKGSEVKIADVVEQAARELERTRFDDPLVEAGVRNAISQSYIGIGRPQDAERELLRARALLDEHGLDGSELAIAISTNLGTCYSAMGKTGLAESEDRRALAGRLALHASDHGEVAIAQSNLAFELIRRNAFAEALELATAAHATFALRQGEGSSQAIQTLGVVASALSGLDRKDEAERTFTKARDLADQHLHADHPARLAVLGSSCSFWFSRRRFPEAAQAAAEVAASRERVLGQSHPQTLSALSSLASAQSALGQNGVAEATLRKVIAAYEAKGLRDTYDRIVAGQSLAAIVRRQGRAAEAEVLASELRRIAGRGLPAGHWLAALVTKEHGGCLCDLGRFEEAEPLLLAAHAGLAPTLGPSDYRMRRTIEELVALYEKWQRPADAERWRAIGAPASRNPDSR